MKNLTSVYDRWPWKLISNSPRRHRELIWCVCEIHHEIWNLVWHLLLLQQKKKKTCINKQYLKTVTKKKREKSIVYS